MLSTKEREEMLKFACEATDAAEQLIMEYWRSRDFQIDEKTDRTFVTAADKAGEEVIRGMLHSSYPNHGIIGEEFGVESADAEFQWTIDPIDGTESFICGIPTFGSLLALLQKGEPILGVISHPAMQVRAFGGKELGVWDKHGKLSTSFLRRAPSVGVTNNRSVFARSGDEARFDRLHAAYPHSRIYYDCYPHYLMTQGAFSWVVEVNVAIWDLAPAEALVKALGGSYQELRRKTNEHGDEKIDAVFGYPSEVEALLPLLL